MKRILLLLKKIQILIILVQDKWIIKNGLNNNLQILLKIF